MDYAILLSPNRSASLCSERIRMKRVICDRACGIGNAALACFLAALVLIPTTVAAQTKNASLTILNQAPVANSMVRQNPSLLTDSAREFDSQSTVRAMPKDVVKILINPKTGQLTLIGAPEDIAIIKSAIRELKQKYLEKPDFDIVRVSLKFQLADGVAEILAQSMRLEADQNSRLKISPLHFPEAILLTGPPSMVERAKKIIEKVDRYDYLSAGNKPKTSRPKTNSIQ
jgi:hypothetical protein